MESPKTAHMPTRQLVGALKLTVWVKDDATGEMVWQLGLPVAMWLALYQSCAKVGQETTTTVAHLGVILAGNQVVFKNREALRADPAQAPAVRAMLEDLASPQTEQAIASNINDLYTTAREMWHDEEEIVLDATYQLLRSGQLDHFGAARAASSLLGKPLTAIAWRLRVARWAKKNEKPPVNLARGGNRRQPITPSDDEDSSSVQNGI